ncbi:hypothetical protein [Deinococcus multiflagellatus]|nr:hypothetical protein [Deinococcus multiflagellatus]MBZ9714448.1 hypothetical protein [Deinococcus multiflagellatus]
MLAAAGPHVGPTSLPDPPPAEAPMNLFPAATPHDQATSFPPIDKDLAIGDIANLLYTYDGEAIVQWAMSALEPKFEWVIHHQGVFPDQDVELVEQLQEVLLLLCAKIYPLPPAVSAPFMKRLEEVDQRLSSSA